MPNYFINFMMYKKIKAKMPILRNNSDIFC